MLHIGNYNYINLSNLSVEQLNIIADEFQKLNDHKQIEKENRIYKKIQLLFNELMQNIVWCNKNSKKEP